MHKRPKTSLYFTSVVVVENDLAIIGGHLYLEGNEPTITRFMACQQGNWGHLFDVSEIVYAATKKPSIKKNGRASFCLLGREGLYRETVTGHSPVDTHIDISKAGYLMDLRYIGKHLYACGVQNQVHCQTSKKWKKVDQGAFSPFKDIEDSTSFESIDGFSEKDIYAVTDGGEIWHWDGRHWKSVESPTTYPLYCVLCSSSGDVFLGGSNGLLFKGRLGKGWVDLSDHNVTDETFEDMTEFQGKIYITATELLACTDGSSIKKVTIPIKTKKAFYAIDSLSDSLWCVGDECVLQFDGKNWKQYTCPDNI